MNTDLLAHSHVQAGVGHNTYISGEEHMIENEIVKILKYEPQTIFDVGANIGTYAKVLRKRFPIATIHCFEPVQETYHTLLENTKEFQVICNNVGLSSIEEQIDLYIGTKDTDRSMATAYPESIDQIFTFIGKPETKISCNFITLDSYCKSHQLKQIDFLKIDVEGHELNVLKGAKDALDKDQIRLIQFEFNEFNISSRSFMKDFYSVLPQFNFFRIMPNNTLKDLGEYNSSLEIFRYQNILAVHKNLNFNQWRA